MNKKGVSEIVRKVDSMKSLHFFTKKTSLKKAETLSLPNITGQSPQRYNELKIFQKKTSIPRTVNFDENIGASSTVLGENNDSMLQGPMNISNEISKMIPVRGPTIFERQLQDFVHGPQSKSGNQSSVMLKLKQKMKEA